MRVVKPHGRSAFGRAWIFRARFVSETPTRDASLFYPFGHHAFLGFGWLGVHPAISHRHAAEQLANALLHTAPQENISAPEQVRNYSDVILISDFLSQDENRFDELNKLAQSKIKGHIVQMVDPAEESFPYAGRVEFTDPETGQKIVSGSAQSMRDDYMELFNMHTMQLAEISKRLGWSHTTHHTDKPASDALVQLHLKMSNGVSDFQSKQVGGER